MLSGVAVHRLAATLGVAALVLGACGTDEGDSAPSGARAAYIAKADPICAEMRTAVGTLGDDAEKDRDAIQAALEKLNALKVPGEEDTVAKVFLNRLNNVSLSMEDLNQSRIQQDVPRANRALDNARQQDEQATDAARSYGFADCAKTMPTS